MKNKVTRGSILRVLIIIGIVLLIALLLYLALSRFLPGFLNVLEKGSEAEIEAYIISHGSFTGIVLLALLQFFQVVSVVCPGMPIQIAAGLIYGVFGGFAICYIAYNLANLTVFFVMRKLGGKLKDILPSERRTAAFSFITESEYPAYMVVLACLMPILPNGIIPYVAARTRITTKQFALSVLCGSLPTIFILCAVGNRILMGEWLFAGILFGSIGIVIILLYIFRGRVIELVKNFSRPKDQ